MQPLYLLHLDRHHLGDELFLNSLAQSLSSAGPEAPATLLVHGSGEKVDRTLEAQGHFPERTDGLLNVETEEQRRLVERAVREMNQELVAALTDEVVSTVGIQGVDRGLFRRNDDGELEAGNVGWLSALVKQHVVPVVSALVESPESGTVQEVRTADAVVALAQALEASFDPVACVFVSGDDAGIADGEGVREELPLDRVTDADVPEPGAVDRLVAAGLPVLATNVTGLLRGGEPTGTRIRA